MSIVLREDPSRRVSRRTVEGIMVTIARKAVSFCCSSKKKRKALGQWILIPSELDYAGPFTRCGSRYSPGVIFMCRLKALVNAATDS